MNANAIVMTPEQLEEFKRNVKAEVIHELSKTGVPINRGIYTPEWISIRDELEEKLRGDYNDGCGHWYQNQQGLYAAFRLAFRRDSVKSLRSVKNGKLSDFHRELFELINKYREDGKEQ